MKKLIFLLILAIVSTFGMAANRTGTIKAGSTSLSVPMTMGASDTINESQTVTFIISNGQKYMQFQTFTVTLDNKSGTTDVVCTGYGKVNAGDTYVQIGSPVTLSADGTATITATEPHNYNYLKLALVAGAGAQHSLITAFTVKTANALQIPANSGTLTVSRATTGAVTITSKDNDANAALTVAAGGTGSLTLGDANSTTEITSSDWAIGNTGAMTGIGAITSDGAITTSAIITGGYKLLAPVLNTDSTETLTWSQSGKMIIASNATNATTITLPDPLEASIGVVYYLMQTANQNLVLTTVTANNNAFVCDGVATSDKVTISTADHKIGAGMFVVGISATKYYVGGLNPESVLTPEAAD